VPTATFWFDPACYWSWRAARWLTDAAGQRDLTVDWRPFSLKVLYGKDIDPGWVAMLDSSHRALRIIQALHDKDRGAEVEEFYRTLGTAAHEQGQAITADSVRAAAASAKVDDVFDAYDDDGLDAAIEQQTSTAIASAGPDIGSPVLLVPGAARGVYGPVFETVPPAAEAGELYDAVARLATAPYFFELKRGHA